MASHSVAKDETLAAIATLYYETEEATEALASCNKLKPGTQAAPGTVLQIPKRLVGNWGVADRSPAKSVVELRIFERRLVFVCVEESFYPGGEQDRERVREKWLYVVSEGAVVVRAAPLSASEWDVDNQVAGGRRLVSDGAIMLRPGKDYSFFLSPIPLTSKGEDYLLGRIEECITAAHLKAVRQDTTALVRDAYQWAVDLHDLAYLPKLRAWQEWVVDGERATKLFIASALKCFIDQKVEGMIWDDEDPLSIRDHLQDGEPERFLEEVYRNGELAKRREAELGMARLAQVVESYDHRAIELSAMDAGEQALEASVLMWSSVLGSAIETHPGRVFAGRVLRDGTRIPAKHILTQFPPNDGLQFPQKRYLSIAALGIVKDLAPAWVELHRSLSPLVRRMRLAEMLERLAGSGPEVENDYGKMAENLRRGRSLTQGLKPKKARLKLAAMPGLPGKAEPPPALLKSERLSAAFARNASEVTTTVRLAIEVINLSNGLSEFKSEFKSEKSWRKGMGALGASADMSALIVETMNAIREELGKAAFKRTAAVMGLISGICDCVEFGLSSGEAANKHDYDAAVGLALASAGAGLIAVGSGLALWTAIPSATGAATAGASAGAIVAAAVNAGSFGFMVGLIGAALVAAGSVSACLLVDGSYEEFAKYCFLGEDHGATKRDVDWSSVKLPAEDLSDEMMALIHLTSAFRVELEHGAVTIVPGFYREGDVFEAYLEPHFEGYPPHVAPARVDADPCEGLICQVAGEPLALESRVDTDDAGRVVKIRIGEKLAHEPPADRIRVNKSRLARVRMKLADRSFVPPVPAEENSEQWVEVEFRTDQFGPDTRRASSADPSRRADLKQRPFLPTKEL